jgi:N-acyl-phosphatidylethanolamine-hydrolysing phospholipase D
MSPVSVSSLPLNPEYLKESPPHHVGNPPTSFQNPWESAGPHHKLWSLMKYKWFNGRTSALPLPPEPERVPVRTPNWGVGFEGLKATWFGHASFLVETAAQNGADRGIRIMFDPVFSHRMSPVSFAGPVRFVPLPCTLDEVPEVDLVVISHNHYDHLDYTTIKAIYEKRGNGNIHFFCGLGLKKWFLSCGIAESDVTELDWWHGCQIDVPSVGAVELVCTPSQHASARTGRDAMQTLWCSWVLKEVSKSESLRPSTLFFAGDTGYQDVSESNISRPPCPAFAEIGKRYGPMDLALLPIGCFLPREIMSTVHASPEDSIRIHKDVRSKRSIGMHYGTIQAGISGLVRRLCSGIND